VDEGAAPRFAPREKPRRKPGRGIDESGPVEPGGEAPAGGSDSGTGTAGDAGAGCSAVGSAFSATAGGVVVMRRSEVYASRKRGQPRGPVQR
jgi:hypothetical protein